jgi:POT family proton-dependent oligopeptide transporter
MSVSNDELEPRSNSGFFGHPWGLSTLFFTEMWERFSYYGMRAILFLYMTSPPVSNGDPNVTPGGLGWAEKDAGPIFGLYAASVYFLPLIGGWIADRFIGAKRATLVGGVIIMLGHFSLAVPTTAFFYLGLVLVAVGTGFLKSNISAMVGHLYEKEDPRRDAGFSVFYMGINIGAFASPLVCGWLAQSDTFRNMIAGWGFDPNTSWHFGFAAAGVGMFFGLAQYLLGARNLHGIGEAPTADSAASSDENPIGSAYIAQMLGVLVFAIIVVAGVALAYDLSTALKYALMPVVVFSGFVAVLLTGMQDKLTVEDWKRIGVITILFCFSMLFWMGFEQASTSFNAFAEKLTDTSIFGYDFPASWLQAVNPLMIIAIAPIIGAVWLKLGTRQPSDSIKFSIGLLFGGLGFVVVAYAASLTGAGRVSPLWLCLVYFCHTIGELCLSPVGLSSMTKLAPGRMVSLMLGIWFLSISGGNYVAGLIAGEFVERADVLSAIFMKVAAIMIGGAVLLFAISPLVKKLYTKPQTEVPYEP